MEELREIIARQKSILNDLEGLSKQYDVKEHFSQNKTLSAEVENCRKEIVVLKEKCKELAAKNEDLNLKLTEQILDEKLNILKISKEKIETYFRKSFQSAHNRLYSMEQNYTDEIKKMKAVIEDELGSEDKENFNELRDTYQKITRKIENRRQQIKDAENIVSNKITNAYNDMEAEGLSKEQIEERVKQNNFEIKIGLDLINKIGIFLIILGAATALRYTYSRWFDNTVRAVFIFVLGAAFIAAGEWFARKKKTTFALGLNGGGTAILYYAVFSSFFFLKVINMNAALIASVFITALTVFFALRYNSRTTVSFALIGGYLPFFSYVFAFGLDTVSIYGAMIYLFLLNASLVYISFYKRWTFTNYLSFILNMPVLMFLIAICRNDAVNIIYVMSTFFLYLSVTLIYPLSCKIRLKNADIIMLAFNTFISCLLVYGLFERARLDDFRGVLALVFCLVYFALGSFTDKYMKNEKETTLLFRLTSVTFAVLVVPFQFDTTWVTLGWLIEGVLMISYGYLRKSRFIEKSGWVVYAICLASFFMLDFTVSVLFKETRYFHWKFALVTLSSIGILYIYLKDNLSNALFKNSSTGKVVTGFKYFTLLNGWLYLLQESRTLYENFILKYDFSGFYYTMRFLVINILLVLMLEKIRFIRDNVTDYFAVFLDIIAVVYCISINVSIPVLHENIGDFKKFASFVILLLFNAYAYYAIRKLSIKLFSGNRMDLELYPVIMVTYIFITSNIFMLWQFQKDYSSLLISFSYMVLAFLSIIFGLKKKYIYVRRAGLFLAMIANVKLFIYDLSYLSMGYKILAYFSFGLVMLAISYVYQQLKKRMGAE